MLRKTRKNSKVLTPDGKDGKKKSSAASTNSTEIELKDQEQLLGGDAIIQGILKAANEEAAQIIFKVENSTAQQEKAWQVQAERITADGELEILQKKDAILKTGQSQMLINEKKRYLQLSERIVSEILKQALLAAEQMINEPGYPEILEDLITEAALGIHDDLAEVASSFKEFPLITNAMLRKAEERVKKISGRSIKLLPGKGQPLPGQGVVLTSQSGTVAFSNQIRVRLLRYQSEIRHLIYREILTENSNKNQKPENTRKARIHDKGEVTE